MPYIFITAIALYLILLLFVISRIKKCPSDKIMVIYGKLGVDKNGNTISSKCIHGGAKIVLPIIQGYQFLDLNPISIIVDIEEAQTKEKTKFIKVSSRFTVGISIEEGIMQNAAERLLGLPVNQIHDLAQDIIFGQIRMIVSNMDYEQINSDRDKFLTEVAVNVESQLKLIGMRLININMNSIKEN